MRSNQGFEILDHPADIKIKIYGGTLKELFSHALQGWASVVKKGISKKLVFDVEREIEIKSNDLSLLLADFLSQVNSLADAHNEVYWKMIIRYLSEKEISAVLQGASVDGFDEEIKAVTYYELAVRETKNGYEAIVVFDI